jgi:hypothetical protein
VITRPGRPKPSYATGCSRITFAKLGFLASDKSLQSPPDATLCNINKPWNVDSHLACLLFLGYITGPENLVGSCGIWANMLPPEKRFRRWAGNVTISDCKPSGRSPFLYGDALWKTKDWSWYKSSFTWLLTFFPFFYLFYLLFLSSFSVLSPYFLLPHLLGWCLCFILSLAVESLDSYNSVVST